jgi:hypothetical protein
MNLVHIPFTRWHTHTTQQATYGHTMHAALGCSRLLSTALATCTTTSSAVAAALSIRASLANSLARSTFSANPSCGFGRPGGGPQSRQIWTTPPACMGRKSAKIAHTKVGVQQQPTHHHHHHHRLIHPTQTKHSAHNLVGFLFLSSSSSSSSSPTSCILLLLLPNIINIHSSHLILCFDIDDEKYSPSAVTCVYVCVECVPLSQNKEDAKRSKVYGKFGKLIVAAVKKGGGADPVANQELAKVLSQAKDMSVPKVRGCTS